MRAHLGNIIAPVALCLILASCAQTGAPLPPSLELPKPPTDLRATRKGNHVTLTWSEPILTTDRQSVRYLGATLICRSLEFEISACGNPDATVPAPSNITQRVGSRRSRTQPKSALPPAEVQTYIDTVPTASESQDPTAELTYAVEVLNRSDRGAGLSNRVHVPAIATLLPPRDLATELTDDGVVLTWTNADESQTVAVSSPASSRVIEHRYRIYRRDEGSGKDTVAGEIPVGETGSAKFTDSSFDWEKIYLYRVTVVSIVKRSDGEIQVEGDDTPPVRVIAHDVFPPSIPGGLQAAYSGEGQKPFIDLIWAPVTNSDLAGYNVYRSEANGAATPQSVKLNSELTKSPSYRDSAVEAGKTYRYSISSVDVRGNESRRSEESSESVP